LRPQSNVTFFQLLFRDLWGWQPPSPNDVSRGVFLIALGLTKKMAFADQFAKVADGYFGNVAAHSGALAAWSGVFAFGLQIYFDFSGYTHMAIGRVKLLEVHFPINFRRPYLAARMTEPWHFGLAALALILAIGEEKWEWFERAIRAPMPVYASALAAMLFCLEIFGVLDAAIPFIYFQF
jgi:hypothetical protein